MTTPEHPGVRTARAAAVLLSPALVWAVVLVLAPFAPPGAEHPLAWGLGAALLVCAVPWAVLAWLGRRGDLRRRTGRPGLAPLAVGSAALMYGTLRIIRAWHGPLTLAAVLFAIFAGYAAVVLARRRLPLHWPAVTWGGAAAVLPLLLGLPGLLALPLPAAGIWAAAVLRRGTAAALAGSVLAGGAVCGGTCVLLLQAVR